MAIDTHCHNIEKYFYPRELFVGRFTIPRFLMSWLCEAVENGEDLCKAKKLLWLAMPGKLKRYTEMVELFVGRYSAQAETLKVKGLSSGVSQMWILGLDIPDMGDFGPISQCRRLLIQIEDMETSRRIHGDYFVPFFPMDPRRPDAVDVLERKLKEKKFFGAKLYPALGYNVAGACDTGMAWNKELSEFFFMMEQGGWPMIVHCSGGGIRGMEIREGDSKWLSSPERWQAVLRRYPRLKVCFAHGTGDAGFLSLENPKPGSWAACLRDLMLRYKGVYADTAFHTKIVKSPAEYKAKFTGIMQGPLRRQILFGSDAFLHFGDYSYRGLMEHARASMDGLDTVLVSNAKEFLGE
jgi:predicted TIM-barrel fold metal-dependent hydrolase